MTTDDEIRQRRMRTRARLIAIVGLIAGGAATAFVLRRITHDWDATERAIREADLPWIGLGLLFAAATTIAQGIGWRSVLRSVGVRVPLGRTIVWYFVGEIGKYMPGGIWPVLGRGELARRGGVPRARAYASVALSMGLLYLAAMLVAVALLPFALGGDGSDRWMLVLLLLPLGIAALHHSVLERLRSVASRVLGRPFDLVVPRWAESLRILLRYVPAWVCAALTTWCIAFALEPGVPATRIAFAAVLAWVAGFVAIPVPAGAGVREAVFVATCGLGGGVAAAVAIIARLLFAVVDGGGALISAFLLRRGGAGAVVEPVDPERAPIRCR